MSDLANIYWSRDNEEFNAQSLGELMDCHDDLGVGSIVYFGNAVPKHASQFIDAGTIIETMQNAAGEFCEWADDYLDDLPEEAIAELDAMLIAWIEKHSKYTKPTWYDIEDAKEYVITPDDIC